MSSKFWYLTSVSLKKKMKTKWFLIINIFLFLMIALLLNIDHVISYFGGDFDKSTKIVVIDKTNYSYDILKNNLEETNKILEMNYKIDIKKSTKELDKEKENIEDNNTIILYLYNKPNSYLEVDMISKNKIDISMYQFIYQSLSSTKLAVSINNSNVDINEINKIVSNIEIGRVILDDEQSVDEVMESLVTTVFPTLILPVFMLVIFLIQMIGTEIYEEKSSRSMEIIISNVSPKVHFASKVFASNIFVLTQGLLLFIYSISAYGFRSLLGNSGFSGALEIVNQSIDAISKTGFFDKLIYIIPLTLILIILSFITYSLIAGILASMTVNMEDYQQIQTPIVLILLASYYLSIMAGVFKGSIFIKILSYIPLISSLLSPALLVIGDIGIIDVVISIFLLIGLNYILISKGLKIYKVGILNYSTDKMWSKIFKSIRSS